MTSLRLVDPTGTVAFASPSLASARPAKWPASARGTRLSFLSNGKPNIASLFAHLSRALQSQGASITCSLVKPGPTTPAGDTRVEQLALNADLVVAGVCDGGTATSWGVHDAIDLRRRGIPTVLVCTDAFLRLAANMLPAAIDGIRVLAIPHPLSSLTDAQTDALAAATAPRLLAMLTAVGEESAHAARDAGPADGDDIDSADPVRASAALHRRGWTEGLPAFVPTEARVQAFRVAQAASLFSTPFAVPPRNASATPDAVAANAVMTGMSPALFPYLEAALTATCQPHFNLFGIQTTTNPAAPAVVVGGPRRREFGFHDGLGALGPGSVSNATLGRALRLCHQNLGGASIALGTDPATLGQPGKYVFCLAEDETANPWKPLRIQVGGDAIGPDDDAVTVMAATGTTNLIIKCRTGEEFLNMLAGSIRNRASNDYMFGGHPLLILCPEHASILANDGWTLEAIQQRVFETTAIRFGDFLPKNQEMTIAPRAHEFERLGPDTMLPIVERPSDFLVCVAGGPSLHSTFVPSFGGSTPAVARVQHLPRG